MNNSQRWLLRCVALVFALVLPFYFLQYGKQASYWQAVVIPIQKDAQEDDPTYHVPWQPYEGVLARRPYSRDMAAVGGLLIPVLLLAGVAYDFLRR